MRLLFVADGRSPTALNWIGYFLKEGFEVHLASTFACQADQRLASFHVTPVAFSAAAGGLFTTRPGGNKGGMRGASAIRVRTLIRQWLGPLTLPRAARRLQAVIESVQPDLVHAMRIPYEGMMAAMAKREAPLVISVWGNDFTLHAPSTPLMKHYTCLALRRADALHADCRRDERLARAWGFAADRPAVVLPGAGGIQLDLFYPNSQALDGQNLTASQPMVINPRGFRAYVRNDTFFRAIPLVLARIPGVRFLCPAMAGEAQAQGWLDELGVAGCVDLLPQQARPQMADLFRRCQVAVSPSTHDGTPNTLLEAMACGCFPIAGDIESLREWIVPGYNGLLFDPADPQALSQAILTALESGDLRRRAQAYNVSLVAERAEYGAVMNRAVEFYRKLLK